MFSYIYDIVVIPATINREDSFGRMERNLVKSELKRVAYFAELSMNSHANNGAFEVLNDIAHHFGIVWSDLLEDISHKKLLNMDGKEIFKRNSRFSAK